ncbi:MAG TPA: cation transporter, partial [Phycisphaerales bacterium]|nr:cation transporter [Phycisphaerales bacterium]
MIGYPCPPRCPRHSPRERIVSRRTRRGGGDQTDGSTSQTSDAADGGLVRRDVPIEGMSCASCAARIEKRLATQPGVTTAQVNFATQLLTVRYDSRVIQPGAIARAVEDLGFRALWPESPNPAAPRGSATLDHRSARDLPRTIKPDGNINRLVVSAVLAIPVVVIAMSHGSIAWLDGWWSRWLQLALTTPVLFWGGGPLFLSAWRGLRRGSASMDTLVALGTGTAFVY